MKHLLNSLVRIIIIPISQGTKNFATKAQGHKGFFLRKNKENEVFPCPPGRFAALSPGLPSGRFVAKNNSGKARTTLPPPKAVAF